MKWSRMLLLVLLAFGLSAEVQSQDGKASSTTGKAGIEYVSENRTAPYVREAWIGFDRQELKGKLFEALNLALDDTTAIACVRVPFKESELKLLEPDERSMMEAFAAKTVHLESEVWSAIVAAAAKTPAVRSRIRFAYVGVMETCTAALLASRNKELGPDNLLLIDPPVGDLPRIEEGARNVGVDVLLHSRSEAEFRRDEAETRKRLGPWGKSARVMRGPDPFANLEGRLKYALEQLRGFDLRVENAKGDIKAKVTGAEWEQWRGAGYQVIHVGELHGNPGAHRLQLEVLREMASRGEPMALSTEQFERDAQGKLDAYLKGEITEEQFLKDSRPWPNYADYRPLIELCKEKKIPVIAGNIPRRLASRVHKEGVEVIEKFSEEEKSWTAKKLVANPGSYRDKFMKAMGGTEGHNAKLDSMYAAQCIKDDTMAESVAEWLKANPKGRVLHINGAFHSESGLGVPEKLKALMPDIKQAMLTCYEAGKEAGKPVENEWYVRVPASRP